MAWLKMTHELPEKPEVLQIASKTGMSRFEVVGRLFILWRWFDNNTTDGNARGVTKVTLEECLFGYHGASSFVQCVVDVGWLTADEAGISVNKFDSHISESAKERAQTAMRVAKSKAKKAANGEGNAPTVTKTVPRKEKRRSKPPQPPEGGSESAFESFWAAWPKHTRKAAKAQCEAKWQSKGCDAIAEKVIAAVNAAKHSAEWVKSNGEFIPAPVVWLNQSRWEGFDGTTAPQTAQFMGAA